MVRLKSKLAALLMAVAMAVSLVACGVDITSVGLPETKTLQKGETLQMEVNYGTENQAEAEAIAKAAEKLELVWKSSNEKVATVDETGLVTAVGAGSADITVSVGELSSVCTVTVEVPAEGVSVPETLELSTNGDNTTAKLDAKATPEDATGITITYESSDENVVTVDAAGLVTAVGNGEADIITTLTQTSETATGETATIETASKSVVLTGMTHVVVTTAVESVTFDDTEGILTIGNSYMIQATVSPEDASDKNLTWTSSDTNIATVDESGNVSAEDIGSATITATSSNGVSANYQLTVKNIVCSYCGGEGHTSSNCPVKAADQKAAAQAAAEAAAQAAAQQQQAQSSGGGTATSGGSSGGGTTSSSGNTTTAPSAPSNPAPAPDPAPSGGSSGGDSGHQGSIEVVPGGSDIVTGGGNGVGVDAP